MLREAGYDDYKLPRLNLTCTLGTAAVRAMSIFEDAGTRSFLRTHLGGELRLSNAKIRRDLDMSFRPLEETLLETVSDLERWGHLAA